MLIQGKGGNRFLGIGKNLMLSRIKKTARGQLLLYSLVAIVLAIAWAGYQGGTWLSGWDALHPEFNFLLSFKRLIFGVFREEQGLGAVAAQSHMADLPRVVILALFSLVLPQFFIKYFFIALTLVFGVLGTYFFIQKVFLKVKGERVRKRAAFLGALFYLFNLGTLQHYIVIQEMFAVNYASLPWLFLTASSYLYSGSKKYLALFALVTLLATPMAHTPTLWYTYMFIFTLFLGFFLKKNFQKVISLAAITLVVNSFWLLPNLYFVLSGHASQVQEAKINKIFSEEAFLHNQNYGNIPDLLILKNFLFEWLIYTGGDSDSYDFLLKSWQSHLDNFWVLGVGYLSAAFVLLGLGLAFVKKNILAKAFLIPTFFSVIFLLNNNPPLSVLFAFFQDYLPLFKEALRFPFTKFSILLMFFSACYFSFAQVALMDFFKKKRFWGILQTGVVALSLVVYAWPMFQGEFISRYLQVKIPKEYFEMFEWFNTQPVSRVAQLPVHSFWGWVYYDWGFQGAQFISFGLKQPLLDRDFDRWNLDNEEYFRQFSYAVYSQDPKMLENVLKKYQVAFLILDKNILAPGKQQDKKILFFDEIESLLLSSQDNLQKVKQFGKISVYQTNFGGNMFRAPATFTKVFTPREGSEVDWIYRQVGDYISVGSDQAAITYPFASLSDNQNFLTVKLNQLPAASLEDIVPVEVYANLDQLILGSISHNFSGGPGVNWLVNLDQETLSLKGLQEKEFKSFGQILLSTKTINNLALYSDGEKNWFQAPSQTVGGEAEICGRKAQDQLAGFTAIDSQTLKIVSKNTSACVRMPISQFINLQDLSNTRNLLRVSFQVSSSAPNVSGRFCFFDKLLQRCVFSSYLSFVPADIDRFELTFFADNENNLKAEEVIFSQLKVEVNRVKDIWTINPEEVKEGLSSKKTNFQFVTPEHKVENCADIKSGVFESVVDGSLGFIEYYSLGTSSCGYFSFPSLPHNQGYILSFQSQNLSGLPLRLCVANLYTKRCDVFSALPKNFDFRQDTLLIPPMGDGGVGYDIHFNNYSIGDIPTTNRLRKLQITPFPYYYLTQLNFKMEGGDLTTHSTLKIKSIKKIWPQFFVVEVTNPSEAGLLVLDQAFEEGWWASRGKHVLANGWANGWLIEGGKEGKIIIFFWPQALEFLGFALLGGVGITIKAWLWPRKN